MLAYMEMGISYYTRESLTSFSGLLYWSQDLSSLPEQIYGHLLLSTNTYQLISRDNKEIDKELENKRRQCISQKLKKAVSKNTREHKADIIERESGWTYKSTRGNSG